MRIAVRLKNRGEESAVIDQQGRIAHVKDERIMSGSFPLKGIRVLDLGRVIAAPYCSALLGDLGADVIKIEEPGKGDVTRGFPPFQNGESTYFMVLNRNKRGVSLNLKRGKNVFLRLVETADVIVENFRPGVMKKLGLGYEDLRKVNPRIIYAALSGYGQYGPYSQLPGYDLIAQAMSGVMSITGWPDGEPTRIGTPLIDCLTGMNAVIGILAAIQHRNATGEGLLIDVALVDSAVQNMLTLNQLYLTDGRVPGRYGNRYESFSPQDSYNAKDGTFVIACGNDKLFSTLCKIMGNMALLEMPEYSTNPARVKNRDKLKLIINEWAADKTVDEIVTALVDGGVPAGAIFDLARVCNDPHINGAREMFVDIDHPTAGRVRITGQAVKMSGSAMMKMSSPTLGQHNMEILNRELGFSVAEIHAVQAEE